MENNSLSYEFEYRDYVDLPDVPVDCPGAACLANDAFHVAPLLIYAAIFLVGVPGNIMVAWVSGKWTGRRVRATWFLHLAVADLLCCLSGLLLAVPLARRGHWPFGALGCRLLPAAVLLSMFARVLLLAALSADLCLLVRGCAGWAGAPRARRAWVARGVAWAAALLLTVPSALYRRLHQEHFPARLECVVDYGGSATVEGVVTAMRFICGFLGPLVLVAGCHGVLLCRAAPRHWPLGTTVVVAFFVCWAPYHLLGLVLAAAAPHSALLARALRAEPWVVGLALAHSCLNPFLFLYFGRARLRQSLPAACHWALRESQDQEDSVVRKMSTSQELVLEMEV
ncbi:PREDICTED: C5a anaphylatoxin chemotactic receptor 2 [Chinchilla lanigera]|uniref:C5a anaphylatoxin chemotactic receptor 2 n=1 Tax=Chinchilla lanigera TaxID=34839 RepID=UPI00038E9653|nr:PREDICTED: C5a anaphylatoxin chemotactic receptor 2 [Chinchilla lanigera]XP_013364992.1 PREDICTED: C5a anaphylatoxin chemotactic receptor 2 [Chinchilla lanigera]XP_013364993.1 PREDICTED: C5a anaphylatoxin chemotactic receptor 2 [Chinchilla lanigera]